jgi:type IV secretory pathway VirD2 relaxase
MTGPDDFTPHLGRIRDVGKAGGKRVHTKLRRAVARLKKPGKKSAFTGKRYGAGGAARTRTRASRHLARQRVRRVVVKVHIARAGKGGPGLYRAHVGYLQRDGVDRDGDGGRLYDREREDLHPKKFLERSEQDRHQFRLIVSPEDGVALGDLKPAIREFMAQVEKDTGRRLDWIAVDHHNTGHPHTHIVIRGRDARMKDVVIAKDYLMHGLRELAEDIVTGRLGPRRDLEILRARHSDIDKDHFTGIDRQLEHAMSDGRIVIARARTEAGRFERHLALSRLRHLKSLGLAEPAGPDEWAMSESWSEALRDMGRRGDIIRTLWRAHRARQDLRYAETLAPDAAPLVGVVLDSGPEDELRDTRFLLVEDFDGRAWHVPAAAIDQTNAPPAGAVVEVRRSPAEPRPADRTIAEIAKRSGGVWSNALHAEADPGATNEYRLAHKHRLEALRRAGVVERTAEGAWEVPEDFLERTAAYEGQRARGLKLRTLSWMSLERQASLKADTWLDSAAANHPGLAAQRAARLAFLKREGMLAAGVETFSDSQRAELRRKELEGAEARQAASSGRQAVSMQVGDRFDGRLEGHVNLAQGRMAIIGNEKAFVMVPWRDTLGRQIGREMIIERTARGIGWSLGPERQRGLSR